MNELKPCPFCGGEAQFARGFDHGDIGAIRWVSCTRCGAMTRSKLYKTEKEAAVAWNTRAERTCHRVVKTRQDDRRDCYCSECNTWWPVKYRYCPNCGAKVVN